MMRFVKSLARVVLIIPILILIIGVVLLVLGSDIGMKIVNYIGFLPGTALALVVISKGAIAESIPIIILGFAVPFLLLIGTLMLGRKKILSRLLVYPIHIANLAVWLIFCHLPSSSEIYILALVALLYPLLTLLADLLPD